MRISSALLVCVMLAGCGDASDNVVIREPDAATVSEETGDVADGRIECAPVGSSVFERVCSVDRVAGSDGAVLTVRQPDGGFHRLLVTRDGRGIVAADGAEPARVAVRDGGEVEVTIGGARYRLPTPAGS